MRFRIFLTKILLLNLIFTSSCISLKDNQEIVFDKNSKVISILSLRVFFNNKLITQNSDLSCQIDFVDDYNNKVTKILDKFSNYIILKSNPGKIFIKNIRCSTHWFPLIYGVSRLKNIQEFGFVAHKGFINYAGDITINYKSSHFKFLDLFNLASLINDDNGNFDLKCEDKILDTVGFINERFRNVYHLKITKSLMVNNFDLKPNEDPQPYEYNEMTNDIQKNNFNSINNNFSPINQNLMNQNSSFIENKNLNFNDQSKNFNFNSYPNDKKVLNPYLNNQLPINPLTKPLTTKHPYLAGFYSEFYTPIYNPYINPGNNGIFMNNYNSETQDLLIEKPN